MLKWLPLVLCLVGLLVIAGCGGSSSSSSSSSTAVITPTLTQLSPTSIQAAGLNNPQTGPLTLTLTGTGFIQTSSVLLLLGPNNNAFANSVQFVNSSTLQITLPTDITSPGTIQIEVVNLGPPTASSNTLPFTISSNPAPSLNSISPSTATTGDPALTLTVNGANFFWSSTVLWNGSSLPTTFVSNTQLTAVVATTNLTTAGSDSVAVSNPTPGGGTSAAASTLTVNNPTPVISSLSPSSATVGATAFTLTLNGSNFVSGATAQWNGVNRTTTFVSSTQLSAAILQNDIGPAGTNNVTVVNPAPTVAPSAAAVFTVNNPAPIIASLSPTSATAGGSNFTLTVNGSGFVSGATVQWNGSNRTTGFNSGTQLTATILASDITTPGTTNVTVINPSPSLGASAASAFSINNPLPVITSLSPASVTVGGAAFTLTLNGTGFLPVSTVYWNGNSRTTTFVNGTQLTAAILASDVAATGAANVTVVNPAPGGGTSTGTAFSIGNPTPTISSLSPASVLASATAFTLSVNGSNFVSGASMQWNGSSVGTVFVSSTQLQANILATAVASAQTVSITAMNPTPGGGTSSALTFIVNNPAPAISTLSPDNTAAAGPDFGLTVNGSNFVPGATVQWNGNNRTTTFNSSTQLTAAISASDIAVAGSFNITVVNPSPSVGPSGAATFTVNNPLPSISSLSPPNVAIGGSNFTLTVSGSGFVSNSTLQWNGNNRSTTFNSSTQIQASVLASDIASAGTYSITVANPSPGGGTSTASVLIVIGVIGRISVATDGTQGNASSQYGVVTSDGRFVAFASAANNLVSGYSNAYMEIFLRDTCQGASTCSPSTTPVTISATGGIADNASAGLNDIAMTPDGRYIAFGSLADNLTTQAQTPSVENVFLRDTCNGVASTCTPSTQFVSLANDNVTTGNQASNGPAISANSRYVAFVSSATNLVNTPPVTTPAIYLRDSCTGASGCTPSTILIATSSGNAPDISSDGRFIAYDDSSQAYIYDTCNGAASTCQPSTTQVSVDSSGATIAGQNVQPSLSTTGEYVAWLNLSAASSQTVGAVLVRDTCLGANQSCTPVTIGASVAPDGTAGNNSGVVNRPSISPDGRFVAFTSTSSNLVAGTPNGTEGVFVRDTCLVGQLAGCTPATTWASIGQGGVQATSVDTSRYCLSNNGHFVVFDSPDVLVSGDTNNSPDVFIASSGW